MCNSSHIKISADSVVELAKNVLRPIKCDWLVGRDVCPVTLGSWTLLQEHEIQHCRSQRQTNLRSEWQTATCGLPRCNARNHGSTAALENHVRQAHMARVPFPCPIDGCAQLMFSRSNQLRQHFQEHHADLNGREFNIPSDVLLPLWQPAYPKLAISELPIPYCPPACALISSVSVNSTASAMERHFISPPKLPRIHQLYSERAQRQRKSSNDDSMPITINPSNITAEFHEGVLIWNRPIVLWKDLSRPPDMLDSDYIADPLNPPPTSILYDVFAQRIEQPDKVKVLSFHSK